MTKKYTIIGGGIAGIFAASYLSAKGCKVTMVERAPELGGLLRSQQLFHNDMFFDFGTHFPQETGNIEIDKILFSGFNARAFQASKVGSYKNSLFEDNGFISDRDLSEEQRQLALQDLIEERSKPGSHVGTLQNQLIQNFGQSYYHILFKDSVEKLLHCHPKELVPNTHLLFGLSRLVVGTAEETRRLKASEKLDQVLAFHSFNEGFSDRKFFYPYSGGAGSWISFLEDKLIKSSVSIIKKCSILSLETQQGKVVNVATNQGDIETDELIWTAPVSPLLSLLNINIDKNEPVQLLTTLIFHFVIDCEYLTDIFYFQCYNKNMLTFRVTLYNNFSPRADSRFMLTAEVLLAEPVNNPEEFKIKIFEELKAMNIIAQHSVMLNSAYLQLKNTFPVHTPTFVESTNKQIELVKSSCCNVKIFGRGSGQKWFMHEIIMDVYQQLKENGLSV